MAEATTHWGRYELRHLFNVLIIEPTRRHTDAAIRHAP
jgi:hypothetical protein